LVFSDLVKQSYLQISNTNSLNPVTGNSISGYSCAILDTLNNINNIEKTINYFELNNYTNNIDTFYPVFQNILNSIFANGLTFDNSKFVVTVPSNITTITTGCFFELNDNFIGIYFDTDNNGNSNLNEIQGYSLTGASYISAIKELTIPNRVTIMVGNSVANKFVDPNFKVNMSLSTFISSLPDDLKTINTGGQLSGTTIDNYTISILKDFLIQDSFYNRNRGSPNSKVYIYKTYADYFIDNGNYSDTDCITINTGYETYEDYVTYVTYIDSNFTDKNVDTNTLCALFFGFQYSDSEVQQQFLSPPGENKYIYIGEMVNFSNNSSNNISYNPMKE